MSNFKYKKGDSEEDDSEDNDERAKKSTQPKDLQYMVKKDPLSFSEVCMHIFGETRFHFTWFLPYYPARLNRNLNSASEIYLQKQK